jgi:UDP-N-acetylglucosamine--N-acetylmuramyl-(pentapeptide) pyrophosphoryl-undecaprenol N-acetylglucosamine transferase
MPHCTTPCKRACYFSAMRSLVLTGGGTAGHVMPNLALVARLRELGWRILYIGEKGGMEEDLVRRAGVEFHGIAAGKLRRYFDWKNFTDPLKVLKGLSQALWILGKVGPEVVFSKGGFVAVPVVWAAKMRGIPVVIHESDMSPGLANRLSLPAADKVCVSFPDTLKALSPRVARRAKATGLPIREELTHGEAEKGLAFLGLGRDKPLLLTMGGSLGSKALNASLRASLPILLNRFHVVHLCGRGNLDATLSRQPGYVQLEFVHQELPDVLAAADFAVSRAGANAVFELLALRLPHILVPLSLKASRGDQIDNAQAFSRMGFSRVLQEERLSTETLVAEIDLLTAEAQERRETMQRSTLGNGVVAVIAALQEYGF